MSCASTSSSTSTGGLSHSRSLFPLPSEFPYIFLSGLVEQVLNHDILYAEICPSPNEVRVDSFQFLFGYSKVSTCVS